MNIGEAAAASGVSAKMIRYYEGIGLLRKAGRTEAGYRVYGPDDLHTLRFVRRARDLGLSIDRIRLLVGLWANQHRSSRDVKAVVQEQVAELEARIAEMTVMRDALQALAEACHGDSRPECPILSDLERAARPLHQVPCHPPRRAVQPRAGLHASSYARKSPATGPAELPSRKG